VYPCAICACFGEGPEQLPNADNLTDPAGGGIVIGHSDHLPTLSDCWGTASQAVAVTAEGEDVTTRKRRRRFHQWVWAAIDPVSKLLLAVVVGDRSLATAWKGVNESVSSIELLVPQRVNRVQE